MKIRNLLSLILLLTLGLKLQAQTLSQEEMMAKMMAANKVGTEHDLLKAMEGKWKEDANYVMMPGQPPVKGTGTFTIKMILGGRFAQVESKVDAMGHKSEHLTLLGHDNRRGVYTVEMFDTYGTYSSSAEGTYDAASKTLTLNGSESDPLMPHPMKFRVIYRFPDKDTIEFEIWFLTDENGNPTENKAVWSTSKRVK